jgi:hypothetical protein
LTDGVVAGYNRTKPKRRVLIEKKQDEVGARLEHSSKKSLKRLPREPKFSSFKYAAVHKRNTSA